MADSEAEPLPALRIVKPTNAAAALGLAVNHLMLKPAFAALRFGDWSRILVGQVNRGHYCFAMDGRNQVQGFLGWAFASQEHAQAWAEGRRALAFEDCIDGDCMVINAWSANSTSVSRFLLAEARRIAGGKAAVYFKRHYRDGSTRPARLAINPFVRSHIARSVEPGAR
jgi:hemolysin-activating ACP:hemolysin acyltransferase